MKFRNLLLVSAAMLVSTASISAQLNHTWVSWAGNDGYTCSSTSPCATFAGALAKTSSGGVITVRDAGDFGPVVINQSITIDGNNLGNINFTGNSAIDITGPYKVTVQNLSINGLATGYIGINASNGGYVDVDNCKITNFTAEGIVFSGLGNLTVENSRIEFIQGIYAYGISIGGNVAQNVVVRNTLIDASPVANDNYGIFISGNGAIKASLQNVTIMGAGSTAFWGQTGTSQITGSVITQSNYGVSASYGATVSVASSQMTNNNYGVCSGPSSKIRLDNNDIYDNPTAIANCGGIVKTSTSNKTSGTISIPAADVSESVTF